MCSVIPPELPLARNLFPSGVREVAVKTQVRSRASRLAPDARTSAAAHATTSGRHAPLRLTKYGLRFHHHGVARGCESYYFVRGIHGICKTERFNR